MSTSSVAAMTVAAGRVFLRPSLGKFLRPTEFAVAQHAVKRMHENNGVMPDGTYTVERNPATARWHKPRYSLRQQATLRKASLISSAYAGVAIPLGPLPSAKSERLPLRTKLPKLPKDQRLKADREAKIADKLAAMDKTLADWRRTKAAEKAKLKSDLPF
ncbi:hypothetical protein H9P43_010137 [Blastocladiella emersonii ATCC 22665]|nr:hypothetical protein H9P43_010137 [Blastocladiella emersonii ATCC 22665]